MLYIILSVGHGGEDLVVGDTPFEFSFFEEELHSFGEAFEELWRDGNIDELLESFSDTTFILVAIDRYFFKSTLFFLTRLSLFICSFFVLIPLKFFEFIFLIGS